MFIKIEKSVKVIYEPLMFQKDFWGYNIKIENISAERLIVVNNYWQIPDQTGYLERVDENHVRNLSLNPGDVCEMIGYPPLQEEDTIVIGSYTLKKENGEKFDLHIPFFNFNQLQTSQAMH